ncbi:uncharacterized protein LOC109837707 isoform X2 [Asparagus officinalis]|uniref:uncharacterized protein LOC109837707 isoform X2 n=1 Tax=Asparagus officinalis TaxID=4686 RepID=UPI00098E574C|nr:uncharacterized protein LOC109837707 isoform X2 [Asparagus officinalis]
MDNRSLPLRKRERTLYKAGDGTDIDGDRGDGNSEENEAVGATSQDSLEHDEMTQLLSLMSLRKIFVSYHQYTYQHQKQGKGNIYTCIVLNPLLKKHIHNKKRKRKKEININSLFHLVGRPVIYTHFGERWSVRLTVLEG